MEYWVGKFPMVEGLGQDLYITLKNKHGWCRAAAQLIIFSYFIVLVYISISTNSCYMQFLKSNPKSKLNKQSPTHEKAFFADIKFLKGLEAYFQPWNNNFKAVLIFIKHSIILFSKIIYHVPPFTWCCCWTNLYTFA